VVEILKDEPPIGSISVLRKWILIPQTIELKLPLRGVPVPTVKFITPKSLVVLECVSE
jgi:hypothetical protein